MTREEFDIYHQSNPEIFKLFEKFTFQIISSGRKYFAAKFIMERIRWESAVSAKNDIFKINNNYIAFYGRLFEELHPEHKGFFRKRRLKDGENKIPESLF